MEGRFTLAGSAAVEAEIGALVRRASAIIGERVPPGELRTLALIGGYGRGEGGVERRGAVERPHNNLDLLLVLERPPHPGLKEVLDQALQPLREAHGVGIDLGLVTVRALRRAPCLVMWYDMRRGHKTVLGDAAFLPSLTHFTREAIAPDDVRNLIVNRGTLLVINDALLARGPPDEEARRTIVRHAVKAIIGYGDALLFFLGEYHWSYAEKRRCMALQPSVPEAFRRLYDEASAFRFEPDYGRFSGRDPAAWMEELRGQLAAVHLACEAIRLSAPGLPWEGYLERALRGSLLGGGLAAQRWLRRARNLLRFRPPALPELGFCEQLGLRLGGPRELLAAAFPAVAYGVGGSRGQELVRRALGAASLEAGELRRAYLRRWAEAGDANFAHVARRHGLDLSAESLAGRRPAEA